MTTTLRTDAASGRGPTHVAVVVPAHDEEARIVATLDSIGAALRRLPVGVTHDVVVVADACEDATAERARAALAADVVVVEVDLRAAGAGRRLGTSVALKRSPVGPERTWIASTDADTLVPPTWLVDQLRLAAAGVVAVAGVVDLRGDEWSDPLLHQHFGDSYGDFRFGPHPHIHGANLGFRGDAYLEVGGWRTHATGEDVDLWHRLRQRGPGLAAAHLRVRTSPRLVGRAPAGFAADLARLASMAIVGEPAVEPAVGA